MSVGHINLYPVQLWLPDGHHTDVELVWQVWYSVIRVCQVICRQPHPHILLCLEAMFGLLTVKQPAEDLNAYVLWGRVSCNQAAKVGR